MAAPRMMCLASVVSAFWIAIPGALFAESKGAAAGCDALLRQAKAAEGRDAKEAYALYLEAAAQSWKAMEETAPQGAQAILDSPAARVNREATFGLIRSAQNAVALPPGGGCFALSGASGLRIRLIGFAWKASDFHKFSPASLFRHEEITHHYAFSGVGAAHLAIRLEQPGDRFYAKANPIAVTAVLRTEVKDGVESPVLELINPFAVFNTTVAGVETPLERDLSAIFAFVFTQGTRTYFRGFVNPSEPDVQPRLLMIEPYQPGKIPGIFSHGLYSEPSTWMDTANELMVKPEFYRRFQLWGFRYPTGGAFLESATAFRMQFAELISCMDPTGKDPALHEIVLVGHSMGGLMSKMQVTSSCNILWSKIAKVPFDNMKITPERREKLASMVFFEPSPNVSRVVYIASPHAGSPMAFRPSGLISKGLVRYGEEDEEGFREFVRDNWWNLQPYFHRRSRPTTIDLLRPKNPLLDALCEMPVSPRVRSHTIVGYGYFFPALRPGDSIVPISSARLPDVVSECMVKAKHTKIHRTSETVAELERILNEHYCEYQTLLAGEPTVAAGRAK